MKALVLLSLLSLLSPLSGWAQTEADHPTSTPATEAVPAMSGATNPESENASSQPSAPPTTAPSQAPLLAVATSSSDQAKAATAASSSVTPATEDEEKSEIDFLQRTHMVLSKLLENKRVIDPFGMAMDPSNTNVTQALAQQYPELEEVPETPTKADSPSLQEALSSLTFTGVYPQKNLLVIGGRQFSVGDVFGLNWQNQMIRLRFEGVRLGKLYFKNLETDEVASLPFNTLPNGFEPMEKEQDAKAGIIPMSKLFIVN